MSPEQARGEATDGRTDIYSLGIVLYEMLSGKVPFDGETTMSVLLKHISEPPPPIPGLSPQLQRVLNKSLAKNREERFQKPAEFARAFNSVVSSETEKSTIMGMMPTDEPISVVVAEPVDSLLVVQTPKNSLRRWVIPALAAIAVMVSAFFLITGYAMSPAVATGTSTVVPTASNTKKASPPIGNVLGPPIVLHFRDANGIVDQAVLEASAMPSAPAGYQYEAWLVGPLGRLSLGILAVDATGKGRLSFNAVQNENLLALYDQAEITLKPKTAATPTDADRVAYTYTLPSSGLAYVRVLLVSSPDTPGQSPLVQGLSANTRLLEQSVRDLSNASANGDQVSVRKHAEIVLNILVGSQSPAHKDWNGDGSIGDPSDGYGFLLNGSNQGYIRAVHTHADYASNAPGASQYMIMHGAEVKACAENLAQWVPQLQAELVAIFAAGSLNNMQEPVQNAAILAEQISLGLDADEDGRTEAMAGECGVATAYTSAYAMADMPLLPIGFGTPTAIGSGTPSPASTFAGRTVTPTPAAGGGGATQPQPAATHAPPGQARTREPKPTKDNGGGGNDGGGNNGGNNGGGNPNKP
jgi:hypothetical protein